MDNPRLTPGLGRRGRDEEGPCREVRCATICLLWADGRWAGAAVTMESVLVASAQNTSDVCCSSPFCAHSAKMKTEQPLPRRAHQVERARHHDQGRAARAHRFPSSVARSLEGLLPRRRELDAPTPCGPHRPVFERGHIPRSIGPRRQRHKGASGAADKRRGDSIAVLVGEDPEHEKYVTARVDCVEGNTKRPRHSLREP